MRTFEELLEEHPFFQGLTPQHLHIVGNCAAEDSYEPGSYIFREGEHAEHFYAIRKGKVALEIVAPPRGPATIETTEAGEALGWSWFFPPYRWRFSARVVEPTQALVLDGVCLRAKCEEDPEVGYEFLKRLAQIVVHRLQMTRLQLLDIYAVPARGRR
jgi:CRP/FNR family transcriptional regulator, cyclic AMP receptor protein